MLRKNKIAQKCIFNEKDEKNTEFEIPQKMLKILCYALKSNELISFENTKKFYPSNELKSIKFEYKKNTAFYEFSKDRKLIKFYAKTENKEIKISNIEYFQKDNELYVKGVINDIDVVKKYKLTDIYKKCLDEKDAFYYIYDFEIPLDKLDEDEEFSSFSIKTKLCYTHAKEGTVYYNKYGVFNSFSCSDDGYPCGFLLNYKFACLEEVSREGRSSLYGQIFVEYDEEDNKYVLISVPFWFHCRGKRISGGVFISDEIEDGRAYERFKGDIAEIKGNKKNGYKIRNYEIEEDIEVFKNALKNSDSRIHAYDVYKIYKKDVASILYDFTPMAFKGFLGLNVLF